MAFNSKVTFCKVGVSPAPAFGTNLPQNFGLLPPYYITIITFDKRVISKGSHTRSDIT